MQSIEIKCGGINLRKLSNPIIKKNEFDYFCDLINEARQQFLIDHVDEFSGQYNTGKYTNGDRFGSNKAVLARIMSACPTREEFEKNKTEWIKAGLKECASADYWYKWEKEWE